MERSEEPTRRRRRDRPSESGRTDEVALVRRENKTLRAENFALKKRVAFLEETVARLLKRIEELERAGKRQASPFSKGDPKPKPKRPGRKRGPDHGTHHRRPPPDNVDEVHDVALPQGCPDCGGALEEKRVADQFQTDLPPVEPIVRQFRIHIGRCTCCGKRVQPRHPLQTSDALGAASVQLGPNVLALSSLLAKGYGLTWGKIADFISRAFRLKAAPSTFCRAVARLAERLGPTHEKIVDAVKNSSVVYPDETGWRVNGQRWWLWVFVSKHATVYRIEPSRGGQVAKDILGEDFEGTIGRDGWAAYASFPRAQTCIAHLLRRAQSIIDMADRGAARFPHGIKRVLKDALALRDRRGQVTEHGFASLRGRIEARADRLLNWRPTFEPNARFGKHLRKERRHLFTFLHDPEVEATNWPAEQAIRPAVLYRKVSGGNRSHKGAETHARVLSVLRTAWQLGKDALALFRTAFSSPEPRDLDLLPAPEG